jgi:structural maintenance of chromosome 2
MGGQAQPAFELVEYSRELEPTIMFGLGGFVVCSSADIAKRIAFNPNRNLRVKCVTLDGDIIDPAGTLTGGYYSSNALVLGRYDEVRKLEDKLV